jgi:hypothetical protein
MIDYKVQDVCFTELNNYTFSYSQGNIVIHASCVSFPGDRVLVPRPTLFFFTIVDRWTLHSFVTKEHECHIQRYVRKKIVLSFSPMTFLGYPFEGNNRIPLDRSQ